jgi:hypothetical protein
MSNKVHPETSPWNKVPISMLKDIEKLPVDLFIKISDVRQVKIYIANAPSLQEIVIKYLNQNIEELFCRKADIPTLTNFLTSDKVSLEKVHKVSLLKELVSSIGVSDEVTEKINRINEHNLDLLKNDSNISNSLKGLMLKGDYLAQHAMILSFISSLVANEMNLGSPEVHQKLTYASMLHDMSLTPEILQKLRLQNNENEEVSIGWREQKKYNHHTKDIIEQISKNTNISSAIIDMIDDHHEFSMTSSIASKKDPSMIPQMNALFAICDEFCHQVHGEDEIELEKFKTNWDTFYNHYNRGNFKKPLECLKRLIFNKVTT